jgi:hypothetical protein
MIRKAGLDRLSPTFAVVALVLALAALVAAASVDAPFRSLLQGGHAARLRILVDLVPVFLLGAGLAVAAALLVRTRTGTLPDGPPFRTALRRFLPPAAAGVAVVSLLLIGTSDFGPREARTGTTVLYRSEGRLSIPWSMSDWFEGLALASEGRDDPERPMEIGTLGDGRLSFSQIGLGLLAVLLGGAVLWYWQRHRARRNRVRDEDEEGGDEEARERARGALADTIRAMLADPDPNTAIRGAYARLLEGLDERGRGRLQHEGPMEHLHRVLSTLRVRPAPLRELIELFELARFSPHMLGPSHRDRALLALRAVAADLEAAPGDGP